MFRIRRVFDDLLPADAAAIAKAVDILTNHFPDAPEGEFASLPKKLRDPLAYRFRTVLFTAERQDRVVGVAIMLHAPDAGFCYLDYLAAASGRTGGGVGSALYQRLQREAMDLNVTGIFCECLPETSDLCGDRTLLRQNAARLRFYERCGMRVIEGTEYATPISEGDTCPPLLLFDGLGRQGRRGRLAKNNARPIVRAILERKYAERCPEGYIERVVKSFQDDPVQLRAPKAPPTPFPASDAQGDMALVVSEKHAIHHVHERGYVEAPVRVKHILARIENSGLFQRLKTRHFPERLAAAVHDPALLRYMKRCCGLIAPGKAVYPYVFPLRNAARPPKELAVRAGYYCIDTFTPLHSNAWNAARDAADTACTAADALLHGYRAAYALVRPPGHHAERKVFGGFCYMNNTAIAAQMLCGYGRVAILDIDYHHGNGTQDIFYECEDVLTISIHGHPSLAYPYFSGFADERGEGKGRGANRNFPLPEHVDGAAYHKVLRSALDLVQRFAPTFLVVALGLDTAKGDPTGTWTLQPADFRENGRLIGGLGLPVLVVQEGGYRVPSLGGNALQFFTGLHEGLHVPQLGRHATIEHGGRV